MRRHLSAHGLSERAWRAFLLVACAGVFAFLVLPLLVVVPLSFSAEPYFTFTAAMLRLEAQAFSLRWYAELLGPAWILALRNSLEIALAASALATALGTAAALGLSRLTPGWRTGLLTFLLAPMIVPVIVVAAGVYFAFTAIGLAQTYAGLVLAHAMLGSPFVVTTVLATLAGYDSNLTRAADGLGAEPWATFATVTLPLIAPGVVSGGLFAFVTSLDEVVVVLFLASVEQRTIPRQMWSGLREQLSPAILAAATLLMVLSLVLLLLAEAVRRRGEKLRHPTSK